MDPLRVLRDYTLSLATQNPIEYREIKHGNDVYLAFGEYAYLKDTPTQLNVYGKAHEFYTLESVFYLFDQRNLPHPTYVKDAAGKGIRAVTRPDRREIIDFLRGDRAEIPVNHDPHHPPQAPVPVSRLVADVNEPDRKKAKLDPGVDRGQRIDALLNKDKGDDQPDASQLRSLNDNLTADKIAALKKKRMNHQKKTIAATADDDLEMDVDSGVRLDRDLKSRERVWRTRANCLEAANKDFSGILEMLKNVKVKEEAEARQKLMIAGTAAPAAGNNSGRQINSAQRPKQQTGYSRYDQEMFTKEMNSDFQIDGEMSFVGTNLKSFKSGTVERKPLASTATAGAATPGPTGPYGRAIGASTSQGNRPSDQQPRKRTNRTPIIVIPSSGTGHITMFNVKELLQELRFVTTEEKKSGGAKRENEVQVHRKRGDVTVPYRVVDNPMKLSEEEWDRVVAVFVMGPAWQFKGWRYNGNPVEIFANIAAFYIYYDDMKVDANVLKWNVTQLPISRDKRHLDKARLAKFWDVVDRYIVKHKSFLRY